MHSLINFQYYFKAILNVIGIVIWTTCVLMHCKHPPNHDQDLPHCEVIFCSHCAVRADWPMHGFSAHFQNAYARITFRKSFAFTCPRIRLSTRITIQNALFSHFKTSFKSLIWNSFAFTRAKIRLSNQDRAESRSETSFGTWFVLMWTGPLSIWYKALLSPLSLILPLNPCCVMAMTVLLRHCILPRGVLNLLMVDISRRALGTLVVNSDLTPTSLTCSSDRFLVILFKLASWKWVKLWNNFVWMAENIALSLPIVHPTMKSPIFITDLISRVLSILVYAVKVRRHRSWSRGPLSWIPGMWFTLCQFHRRRHSFRITLKSTTLLFMRSSNVWTTKPWQRS